MLSSTPNEDKLTGTPPTKTNLKYIPLIAVGAICYSTLIIFTRLTHGLDAMSIAFFRAFFAFTLFLLFLFRGREVFEVRHYKRSIPWLLLLGGAVAGAAACYIYAIQHTTAANASLLVNSAPVYVAIIAPWFLKEARPRFWKISLLLLLIGVVLITDITNLGFDLNALDGIIVGVFSGFFYSLTFLFSRKVSGKTSSITQSLWGNATAH